MGIFNTLQRRIIHIGMAGLLLAQGMPVYGLRPLKTYAAENFVIATNSNASHSGSALETGGFLANTNLSDFDSAENTVHDEFLLNDVGDIAEKFGSAPYDVLIRMDDSDEDFANNAVTLVEPAVNASLGGSADHFPESLPVLLENHLHTGEVESYESYNIFNGIHAVIHSKELLIEIMNRPDVRFVTPNFNVEPVIPVTDTSRRSRRSIELAGLTSYDWAQSMIQADRVWEEYEVYGEGTVVGIIDTGVNYKLPQLRESYLGYDHSTGSYQSEYYLDLISGSSEPSSSMDNDHGTFVAGIISGGTSSHFSKTIGIAPKAKFINVRALGNRGTDANSIIQAAEWMLEKRPDVINCSWGYESNNNPWFQEIAQVWRDAGIVAVFASGNTESLHTLADDGSILSPANMPNVLAVGAIDSRSRLGVFSKRGPSNLDAAGTLIKPDLTAPGINVYSLSSNGYVSARSGTSYATPFVTATIALMKSVKPDLTVDEIEDILKTTARPLTDGRYLESPNMGYGYGMIDAYAAVTKVRELAGLTATQNDQEQGGQNSDAQGGNSGNTGSETGATNGNSGNVDSETGVTNGNSGGENTDNTNTGNTSFESTDPTGHTFSETANGDSGNASASVQTEPAAENTSTSGQTSTVSVSQNGDGAANNSDPFAGTAAGNVTSTVSSDSNLHSSFGTDQSATGGYDGGNSAKEAGSVGFGYSASTGFAGNSSSKGGYGGEGSGRISGTARSKGASGGGRALAKNSAVQTGIGSSANKAGEWKRDSRGWWLLNKDGSYPKSSWLSENGKWYYFDEAGYAVTGWWKIGQEWYYMNQDCSMANGWVMVREKWYYLGANGAMFSNARTPDGFFVGADGAWIP